MVGLELDHQVVGQGALVVALVGGADGFREDLEQAAAEQRLVVAEDALGLAVGEAEPQAMVEGEEGVADALEGAGDVLAHGAGLGGVQGGADHPHGHAGVAGDHLAAAERPADAAVGPDDAVLHLEVAAALQGGDDGGVERLAVVGMGALGERGPGAGELVEVEAEDLGVVGVPAQHAAVEVPVEGAHAGGVEGHAQVRLAGRQSAFACLVRFEGFGWRGPLRSESLAHLAHPPDPHLTPVVGAYGARSAMGTRAFGYGEAPVRPGGGRSG